MTTITGVGPTPSSFHSSNLQQSSSGRILSLALGAAGARMFASTFAGVWRSDDTGKHWVQLMRPQPVSGVDGDVVGALYAPLVFDVAISPSALNLVLAAAAVGEFEFDPKSLS